MLYGKGAGQLAAASAVVSDVTYLARQVAAKDPAMAEVYAHVRPVMHARVAASLDRRFGGQ